MLVLSRYSLLDLALCFTVSNNVQGFLIKENNGLSQGEECIERKSCLVIHGEEIYYELLDFGEQILAGKTDATNDVELHSCKSSNNKLMKAIH